MITTATSLQTVYNRLYAEFRNYVWNFDSVEALADLEIEIYQAFPDMNNVKLKFKKLKCQVSYTGIFQKDDDLKDVFNDFEETINNIEGIYANLKSYREVVVL